MAGVADRVKKFLESWSLVRKYLDDLLASSTEDSLISEDEGEGS